MYDSTSSGKAIFILIALLVFGIVAVLVIMPLSDDAVRRAEAGVAVERERTERIVQEQQTQRHAADLRAESSARIADYGFLVLMAFGVVVGVITTAGAVVYGLNWADNQHTRRTLLILEAQKQERLEAGTTLYLPERKRIAQVVGDNGYDMG